MDTSFELLTGRLRLRPLTPDDVEPLFEVLGEAETMRWYPEPFDRDGVVAWIGSAIGSYQTNGFGLLAIEERASGEFLGDCGPAIRVIDGESHVELGWHVRRDRWGEGIATEAGVACSDWSFGSLDLDHVISLIRPENRQSSRVAEKLGMTIWKDPSTADSTAVPTVSTERDNPRVHVRFFRSTHMERYPRMRMR